MNSQFIKPTHRRWTYISPDKQHRHELDHILANGKYITDVSVVPSFTNGSDHRMLRANVHINAKQAKFEQVKRRKPPRRVLDPTAALLATENLDSCEDQDIDKEYDTLVHALKKAQDAAVTIPTNHSRNRLKTVRDCYCRKGDSQTDQTPTSRPCPKSADKR
ncbi:hypothetical protein CRE_01891 [Caenorhabditis remanei]|uniref:Endonuclease/exonuclease/phosphatase domain-containing protein n=1 Tax=Caenorhabditis remanei TaxID=31234 RepID=E3LG38_CAERE|nr:hypothetical protein CRE_01891 [Caenorhabditis remanei]